MNEGFLERQRERLAALSEKARFVAYDGALVERLPEADALCGTTPPVEVLDRCERLRWVHVRSAGVNPRLVAALATRGITMTKGSGAFDVAIAEHVLAMVFAFSRNLTGFLRNQLKRRWDRDATVLQIERKTLGIYGMGSIGTELARKAHALGMRVYGIALHERPAPSFVEALWTPDRLADLLRVSDFLAVCVPLTPETEGLFGEREFRLMKRTAYFFNIGRGKTVVQEALIAALRNGEIAGAGLDVMDPEPLPPESPLWEMENVLLTPHISGTSDETERRADTIALENIRRFLAGEPLKNVVDPVHGY